MTPYEKAGFDEKSLFITQGWSSGFDEYNGKIVHLSCDDGTYIPLFCDAKGWLTCQGINDNINELPRDEDGYYIWEGGEQPVPDDWCVEYRGKSSRGRDYAHLLVWYNITAFRVVSAGDVQQSSEFNNNEQVGEVDGATDSEDWCMRGKMVRVKGGGIHTVYRVTDDNGVFLDGGLNKCRSELEPYQTNTPSWNETVPEIPFRGDGLEFEPVDPQLSKYHKRIRSETVDVYDVLVAFNVTCPARQHAIKKLLMAGLRGAKNEIDDLQESYDSIERAIELALERGGVMEYMDIKAEVFRTIRANSDKTAKQIAIIIKRDFADCDQGDVNRAIYELTK